LPFFRKPCSAGGRIVSAFTAEQQAKKGYHLTKRIKANSSDAGEKIQLQNHPGRTGHSYTVNNHIRNSDNKPCVSSTTETVSQAIKERSG
jgi:hypothetical protein